MEIADLSPGDEEAIAQVARIMVEAFRSHSPAWADLETAEREVSESFAEDRISRVARSQERIVGWIGGIREYDGNVWELHPLAVDPACQGQGIGRALVADLEGEVAARGASTLWLGTDDEDGRTSLSDVDLYPDPLAKLARIEDRGGHLYGFYLACGFVLAGVVPDANGPGKPDILLAKRVRPRARE